MKRTLYIIMGLLLVVSLVSAVSAPQVYVNSLITDSKEYNTGDRAEIIIQLSNDDSYPVVGGYFVIDLVYVSDDEENIVREKVFRNVNILSDEKLNLRYDFLLPEFLKTGNYRFDVYFKNEKQDYVGHPYVFSGARTTEFTVNNVGTYKDLRIIREKTTVCGKNMFENYEEQCIKGLEHSTGYQGAGQSRNLEERFNQAANPVS